MSFHARLNYYGDEIRMIFTGFLIVFFVLKVTGLIDWSWWWVFSPFWIPLIFAVLYFIVEYIKLRKK